MIKKIKKLPCRLLIYLLFFIMFLFFYFEQSGTLVMWPSPDQVMWPSRFAYPETAFLIVVFLLTRDAWAIMCGKRRVRLCLPPRRSTLVAWWVECWTADSDIRSSMGSNPTGGSHDRWCQKVPALTANWLYCTIPAWNFWIDGYPWESHGWTPRAAVSQLWVAAVSCESRELASRELGE